MKSRVLMLWARVRDSLWFAPAVLTLVAGALAAITTTVDRQGILPSSLNDSWIFASGADGARAVLSAIAGGLITVTGVVFSITIVALQLASSQFTPRLLREFTADRWNQVVLGVFIGTFTYAILVLRTVGSTGDGTEEFVPRLAVAVAVLLVLVSIGSLIFFINHATSSIRVATILERVAERTRDDIARLFPSEAGERGAGAAAARGNDEEAAVVRASTSGYLQAVDAASLSREGGRRRAMIRMAPRIGDFVMRGEPLASVLPPAALDEELATAVRTAFVVGGDRTPDQDIEFGIVEISDIAVKALSPSINDPTTAFRCIDRLAEILLELGIRLPGEGEASAGEHFIRRHTSFERAMGLAFDQIRHFGASNPAVVNKLRDTLARLTELVPPTRKQPLQRLSASILAAARDAAETGPDRDQLERGVERIS